MKQTARTAALQALLQVEENEGYSNIVIDKVLRSSSLERRDAALVSALFYGVLEKRLTLDFYLSKCYLKPPKKLDKAVLAALRCGAYQILYLDRVPDSAAVNETVNAVKALGKVQFSGFVNGVLRGLIRKKAEIALPEGSSARDLSLRYSVPEKLISLWKKAYGGEIAIKLLEAFSEKSRLYLRINPLKTTPAALKVSLEEKGMSLELLDYPQNAAVLENCGSPAELEEFSQGKFHVQDLSAQLICSALAPQPDDIVCDCCAAPGGKSFTLAEQMGGKGKIYSLDLYKGRVGLIAQGKERLGLDNIEAKVNDALKGFEGLPRPDKILCDVPCSGFGVIRRKPEIRYKDINSVKDLPELQYAILKNAADFLKPGGVLLYSTCTLNPAENGEVAEKFLRENDGFEPMNIELKGIERCVDEPKHTLTLMPFTANSDGFYVAAFKKKTQESFCEEEGHQIEDFIRASTGIQGA